MRHKKLCRFLTLCYESYQQRGTSSKSVCVYWRRILVINNFFFLWISLCLMLWRYCPIGRSFFSPDIRAPQRLGDGLESWCGFYQSIRPTQMGLSLNIGIWIMIKFTKLLGSYLWLMFLIFCFYLYFTFFNRYGFSCIHWASPCNRVCCSASRQGCIVKAIVWCWSCEGTFFFLLLLQPGFILDIWFNHK